LCIVDLIPTSTETLRHVTKETTSLSKSLSNGINLSFFGQKAGILMSQIKTITVYIFNIFVCWTIVAQKHLSLVEFM